MPFCRKCGLRIVEYSKSCPECGTSTTAPLIKKKNKPKKTPATQISVASTPKTAKSIIPSNTYRPTKVATPTKTAKTYAPAKVVASSKVFLQAKPTFAPAETCPPHEIKKTNTSIEEDILANPKDYETQTFSFDFKCLHGHFLPAGKPLPVSNGKAFCPVCGEALRKPRRRKPHRYGSL